MSTTTTTTTTTAATGSNAPAGFADDIIQDPWDEQLAVLETPFRVTYKLDARTPEGEAKLRNKWAEIFPPETTPALLVDLGPSYNTVNIADDNAVRAVKWKVILTDSLLLEKDIGPARTLFEEGWGAVSYGWGEYLDPDREKRKWYGDRVAADLPLAVNDSYDKRFQSNVAEWYEESKSNDYDWPIQELAQIPIPTLKKIFLRMKKRFVWWDVACMPQRNKDIVKNKDGTQNKNNMSKKMWDLRGEEVAKQRYTYEYASLGASWVPTVDFSKDGSSLKKVLNIVPQFAEAADVQSYYLSNVRKEKLDAIHKLMSKTLFGMMVPKEFTALKAKLTEIQQLLVSVRGEDAYFRSLWSFQEIRLLRKQYFVDKFGLPYLVDKTKEAKPENYANFLQVALVGTFFASQLSLALAAVNEIDAVKRATEEADPNIVALVREDPVFVQDTLRKVKACGLLFAPQETPLQVIAAARRSRFPSVAMVDNYYALLGVLALDRQFGLEADYNMDIGLVRRKFFEVLIRKYQWRMLLFAKLPVDPTNGWDAISLGHFESVSSFFEAFVANAMGRSAQPTYDLPWLSYNPATDDLLMKPLYGRSDFKAWKLPSTLNTPSAVASKNGILPNNVAYRLSMPAGQTWLDVETKVAVPKDVMATSANVERYKLENDSTNNTSRLLIPIQALEDSWSPLVTGVAIPAGLVSQRCLLIENFKQVGTYYTGTFGSIIDVKGIEVTSITISDLRLAWQKKA